jgi:hypothetical protein
MYFIEFWHGEDLYFRYKAMSSRENFDEYAREIVSGFFEDDSATPRIIMPDARIPSQIRIVDEDGKILGQRSLVDEIEARRASLRSSATPQE